jgi:hypothetical protein
MRRLLEPVDLMVAVGLCATIFCGYLMFMATSGTLAAAPTGSAAKGQVMTMMDAMEWVQPALGEAIVRNTLLAREVDLRTTEAANRLNRATLTENRLKSFPSAHIEQLTTHADLLEVDHGARVQFVLGRRIVDWTSRGIRTGMVSAAQSGSPYNRKMIKLVKTERNRMNDQFQNTRESVLGNEIVTASRAREQYAGEIQGRIGQAIADITRIQHEYGTAIAGAQEQLASVTLAALHTEEINDRFNQLATADLTGGGAVESRSWPEVSGEYLLAGCVALIGIFFAGLVLPLGRGEPMVMEDDRPARYRRTA